MPQLPFGGAKALARHRVQAPLSSPDLMAQARFSRNPGKAFDRLQRREALREGNRGRVQHAQTGQAILGVERELEDLDKTLSPQISSQYPELPVLSTGAMADARSTTARLRTRLEFLRSAQRQGLNPELHRQQLAREQIGSTAADQPRLAAAVKARGSFAEAQTVAAQKERESQRGSKDARLGFESKESIARGQNDTQKAIKRMVTESAERLAPTADERAATARHLDAETAELQAAAAKLILEGKDLSEAQRKKMPDHILAASNRILAAYAAIGANPKAKDEILARIKNDIEMVDAYGRGWSGERLEPTRPTRPTRR